MCKHLLTQLLPRQADLEVLDRVITVRQILVLSLRECGLEATQEELCGELIQLANELAVKRDIHGALRIVAQITELTDDVETRLSLFNGIVDASRGIFDANIVDRICTVFDELLTWLDDMGYDDFRDQQEERLVDYLKLWHVPALYSIRFLQKTGENSESHSRTLKLIDMASELNEAKGEASDPYFQRVLATLSYNMGNYREAVRHYLNIVLYEEQDEEHLDFLLLISKCLAAMGHDESAQMFLHEIQRRISDDGCDERLEISREELF